MPRLAAFTPPASAAIHDLKRFLTTRVYSAPELCQERERSSAMIAELFQFFMEQPGRLPEPYAEMTAHEAPHRVVCDYIAGMTDGFFHRTYEQTLGH